MPKIKMLLTTKEYKQLKILALAKDRTLQSYAEHMIRYATISGERYKEPITYVKPYIRLHDVEEWAYTDLKRMADRDNVSMPKALRFIVIEELKRNPITISGEVY